MPAPRTLSRRPWHLVNYGSNLKLTFAANAYIAFGSNQEVFTDLGFSDSSDAP